MNWRKLARNEQGASAIEFAVAAPILILLIVGMIQLGIVFYANAGLQQAVEAGARYATIYPVPSDSEIQTTALDSGFGMKASNITGPTIVHGTTNGVSYIDLSMSYQLPLNFGLFETPPITLSYTRRAYQPV